jgi:very-short-patch-repair endonuclease
VIELDDRSHAGKASQDKARDEMLEGAGYRTARFKNVPDVAELKQTIERCLSGSSSNLISESQ